MPGVIALSTNPEREGERVSGSIALRGDEGVVVSLDGGASVRRRPRRS